jgi:hypothetical protein
MHAQTLPSQRLKGGYGLVDSVEVHAMPRGDFHQDAVKRPVSPEKGLLDGLPETGFAELHSADCLLLFHDLLFITRR